MRNKAYLGMAIEFARRCEQIAPRYGFHTALTGGCLYKDGMRKDLDILFYQRTDRPADKPGLLLKLASELDIAVYHDYGFVVKAATSRANDAVPLDLLFPGPAPVSSGYAVP